MLTEAIVMGHDLGHTPFGHAGEKVLAHLMPDGFHHVKQSLRVVDQLERDGAGLNLTHEVRDGILKHSKGKGAIFSDNPNLTAMTLEGQIVRIADIAAYVNHDYDDAVRAGLISDGELPEIVTRELGATHSARINSLVTDLVESSRFEEKRMIRMSEPKLQALYAHARLSVRARLRIEGRTRRVRQGAAHPRGAVELLPRARRRVPRQALAQGDARPRRRCRAPSATSCAA